ncbi:MAG: hypothetical protein AAGA96_05220 [Verrucomicrobiota bacterium]
MRRCFPLILAFSVASTAAVHADIVERSFVQGETGQVTSGYVLQGSRNMRNLGKQRSLRVSRLNVPLISSDGVPLSSSAQTVIPALRNEVLQTKPRFGYGSDYQSTAADPDPPARMGLSQIPQSTGVTSPVSVTAPSYTFYSYYQPRQYFRTYRYPFGGAFFGGPYGGYRPYGPLYYSYRPTISGVYRGGNWAIGFRW